MYELRGQSEFAEEHYRTAIARDPFLKEALFMNSSELRKQIVQSIDAAPLPVNSSNKLKLGYDALQRGNLESAQEQFQELIDQPQPDSAPYVGLAKVYLRKDQLNSALKAIDLALYLDQNWPRTRMEFLKAEILYESELLAEANLLMVQVFEDLVNSSSSGPYYSRAYYRYYIQPDKIPFLLRGGLTVDMANRLVSLANSIEYQNSELADRIIALVGQEKE
jgi:tetratricopeptide (TPR) repeat protein